MLLDQYLMFVRNKTVEYLAADVVSEIETHTARLRSEIVSKRKLAKLRRQDYQQALQEAL